MTREKTAAIPCSPEFRDWVVSKKRGNETYEDTLRRLLELPSEGLPDAGIKD